MGIPRDQVEHLIAKKAGGKPKAKRNKYGVAPKAERTLYGHVFHSKKECQRYFNLNSLWKFGVIRHLVLQPLFLLPGGVKYYADFAYYEDEFLGESLVKRWVWVVEDCKGFKTEAYKLKKKQVESIYGIKIRET